jgi:hypothetical protein
VEALLSGQRLDRAGRAQGDLLALDHVRAAQQKQGRAVPHLEACDARVDHGAQA